MSKVERLKNGIRLICDCGAVHILTIDENDEIVVKSEFKKNNKEQNIEDKTNEEKERTAGFFGIFGGKSDD